jgi:serine/threonine-protein kinase
MPDVLGRYRLMKLLATGGMGEVFLARQEGPAGFAKTVVVKRILRHLAQDQGFIDLFLNEAQMAAQLQHPHIAQVFGLEHEGQDWFIAMEYVHGRSVRDLVEVARARSVAIPPVVAARLASQALQGLHYAHQLTDARGKPLGILHRDVTPDNLLVSFSGILKLVDFGIARAMTGAETRVGRPKGKVAYMAPELTMSGAPVDGRADLYGVGVVLYELLRLARPPNVPSTPHDAAAEGRRAYQRDRAIAPALNDILAKAMAPAPRDRFASAQAMSDALERWLRGEDKPVMPGDLTAFLATLYGREVVDANPSVLPLMTAGAPTSGPSTLGGTQPLAAVPLEVFEPSQAALRAMPVPAEKAPARRRQRWVVVGGILTLGALAAVVGSALWPPPGGGPLERDGGPDASASLESLPLADAPDAGLGDELALAPGADADSVLEVAVEGLEDGGPEAESEPGGAADDDELPDAGLGPDRRPSEPSAPEPRIRRRRARTGRVVLKVAAGWEVSLSGRALGVTPLGPVEVPSGLTTFVLRHKKLGVTRRLSVRVPPGRTVSLRAELPSR